VSSDDAERRSFGAPPHFSITCGVAQAAESMPDNKSTHPLVLAYHATDYVAFAGSTQITLRIGRRDASVDRLLVRMRVATAAFVTAWNPFSRVLSDGMNRARQARLEADLRSRGLRYLRGEGRGMTGNWPPEESAMIFNLSRQDAGWLGRRWGQNAIVYVRLNRAPELIMLRACMH
jgi:hypothetical protein